VYAEDWGQGFDLLYYEPVYEATGASIAGNPVEGGVGGKKSASLEKEEVSAPVNMVMENSLVLEPIAESEDVKSLKSQVEKNEMESWQRII